MVSTIMSLACIRVSRQYRTAEQRRLVASAVEVVKEDLCTAVSTSGPTRRERQRISKPELTTRDSRSLEVKIVVADIACKETDT